MNLAEWVDIVEELQTRGVLPRKSWEAQNLRGTTAGRVYTLADETGPRYVLKMDDPRNIRRTAGFLADYPDVALFPRLVEADPVAGYLLYGYQQGTTFAGRGPKAAWMKKLTEDVLNRYVPARRMEGWGRVDWPCGSWGEWNRRSLESTREAVRALISPEDQTRIETLVSQRLSDEGPEAKYWLHGDAGAHNFVFDQDKLVGVIDPDPMAGPVLYDFTYAYCSTPDDLDLETLRSAYALLRHTDAADERKLIGETVFQLYCRIGICTRHHPQDLTAYMAAWSYWRTNLTD